MKLTHSVKNNTGIGLIEVLITTVVVAVGLLAVASLQGDLLGSSRSNKTRAEAQALANTKIEQLRDTIEKTGVTGYDTLLAATPVGTPASDSIGGITETFTRNWTLAPKYWRTGTQTWTIVAPVAPEKVGAYDVREVSVTVCWSDGCTGNNENKVTVQSVIAFDNLGNSALAAPSAAGAGAVGVRSLNANSSDDISENITLPTAATPGSVVTVNGKTYVVQNTGTKGTRADICDLSLLTPFENGLMTRRDDYDKDPDKGKEAIYLYEKVNIGGTDYCIPRVRYNGGVIIPIKGTVYSRATDANHKTAPLLDINLFTFNANESGTFCVFKPSAIATSAPYVCYVGGNCAGATKPPSIPILATECPNPGVANPIVGVGGWRGKVGLLGVAANGKNACFAEEIAGTPDTLDTARNYFTRNGDLNEGINKPYSCHDFLIINGQSTEEKVHDECVIQANAISLTLASKIIERSISGNNVYDPIPGGCP